MSAIDWANASAFAKGNGPSEVEIFLNSGAHTFHAARVYPKACSCDSCRAASEQRAEWLRAALKVPDMVRLLYESAGEDESGDGFCDSCGRDVRSGAPHSSACRVSAVLRSIEGEAKRG